MKDHSDVCGLGNLSQNFLHLGGVERAHRLCADVAEHVRCQQHTGGRLIVRGLEDTHSVVLTERPVHLLIVTPIDCTLAAQAATMRDAVIETPSSS